MNKTFDGILKFHRRHLFLHSIILIVRCGSFTVFFHSNYHSQGMELIGMEILRSEWKKESRENITKLYVYHYRMTLLQRYLIFSLKWLHLQWLKNPTVDPNRYKLLKKCLYLDCDCRHKDISSFVKSRWTGFLKLAAFIVCKFYFSEVR